MSITLAGVFTVLSFVGSMLWMNVAADELVGLLVAVGHVMELPAALLGATVLAWGNSLSDTVSNLTMARDGCVLFHTGTDRHTHSQPVT